MRRRTNLCTAICATALLLGSGAAWAEDVDLYLTLPVAEVLFPDPSQQALCDDVGGVAGHVSFSVVIEKPHPTYLTDERPARRLSMKHDDRKMML